jgi:hypothetical protein
MIGSAGMLRGWTMLWQMELMWLLPALLVSVMVIAQVEKLIWRWRQRRPPVDPRSVEVCMVPGGVQPSPPAFTDDLLYDGTPRVAFARVPRMLSPQVGGARPVMRVAETV